MGLRRMLVHAPRGLKPALVSAGTGGSLKRCPDTKIKPPQGSRGGSLCHYFGTNDGVGPQTELILARFLWGDVAGMANLIDVQTGWAEFGDLASTPRGKRDIEDLRADQATRRSLIH